MTLVISLVVNRQLYYDKNIFQNLI